MRKEPCYMVFNSTSLRCSKPMSQKQTKMLCCCSMGEGWGDSCLPCPKPDTGMIFSIYDISYKRKISVDKQATFTLVQSLWQPYTRIYAA